MNFEYRLFVRRLAMKRDHGSYYLPLCLWIGLWTSAILIALVAFDASALVCYVTWFTEENFATLISIIFIYKAVEKLNANSIIEQWKGVVV
ncbi:sodium bicarbonate cotransporter 3-like isoform X3 [Tachypleus tridentatus]|uniref:sodium bicarbonate cotransporter 3-like isoform X3 n=1 Tax=Tachypleus tridentatus TaxID=6853 RepID=UPI003FD3FF99